MPFFNINEMKTKRDKTAPGMAASIAGEFMKVGVMTYEDEIGPPPHFHPNEEQFILVLEGKLRMVLGSPGGPQIICYVAASLVRMLDLNIRPENVSHLPNICNRGF